MDSIGKCSYCGIDAKKKCGNCKSIWYCSKEHQKMDWKDHRDACNSSLIHQSAALDAVESEDTVIIRPLTPDLAALKGLTLPSKEDIIAAILLRANRKKKDGFCRGQVETFFDIRINFKLIVETDLPPYTVSGINDKFCYPDTKLLKCTASEISKSCESPLGTKLEYLDYDSELYKLSKKELKLCVLKEEQIKMQSGIIYKTPIGKRYFSLKDLVNIIVKDEEVRRANPSSYWFDGIDVQNVVFEGLKFKNGTYISHWGS